MEAVLGGLGPSVGGGALVPEVGSGIPTGASQTPQASADLPAFN